MSAVITFGVVLLYRPNTNEGRAMLWTMQLAIWHFPLRLS